MQQSFETFWNYEASVPVAQVLQIVSVQKEGKVNFERLWSIRPQTSITTAQVRKFVTFRRHLKCSWIQGLIVWTDSIQFISDKPGKMMATKGYGGGISTDSLFALKTCKKKCIDIQSPYLIMDEKGIELMRADWPAVLKLGFFQTALPQPIILKHLVVTSVCRKALPRS